MDSSEKLPTGISSEYIVNMLAVIAAINVALGFVSMFMQRIIAFFKIQSKPLHVRELIVAYQQAKSAMPDPNELKELSKSTGRTIEELNQWFRSARSYDRSVIAAERLHEAIMRLLLLSTSFVSVLGVHERYLTSSQAKQLRVSIYMQLLLGHVLAKSTMPNREFFLIGLEIFTRLLSNVLLIPALSELIIVTHDSVDISFELSKVLDLVGRPTLATVAFAIFGFQWIAVRMAMFAQGLADLSVPKFIVEGTFGMETAVVLWVIILFDLWGCITVLRIAYSSFWSSNVTSRRVNRGDSLSSATSMEYESDSSLSSNLRWDTTHYKDD